MRITVAVPTYKRPNDLSRFIDVNLPLLDRLDVFMAIFHNEPNPDYSPQESRRIKTFFKRENRGITGNAQLISSYFINPYEYYIYASDQETINPSSLAALINLIYEIKPSCVGFIRGTDNTTSKVHDHYICNSYANWLEKVAVSETVFAYKGGLIASNPFRNRNLPGMAMWRSMPTHSLVLHSAVRGDFLGVSTGLSVYEHDIIGSVASGWTSWIPNIIICHVVFIRYTIYAFHVSAKEVKESSSGQLAFLVNAFAKGLHNHAIASVALKMYSGPRLSSTIRRLMQSYPSAFASGTLESLEEFFVLNSEPLTALPYEWSSVYKKHKLSIERFKSTYPDWGYL